MFLPKNYLGWLAKVLGVLCVLIIAAGAAQRNVILEEFSATG